MTYAAASDRGQDQHNTALQRRAAALDRALLSNVDHFDSRKVVDGWWDSDGGWCAGCCAEEHRPDGQANKRERASAAVSRSCLRHCASPSAECSMLSCQCSVVNAQLSKGLGGRVSASGGGGVGGLGPVAGAAACALVLHVIAAWNF